MKIVLASNNKNKLREMREIMASAGGPISQLEVITLSQSGYNGTPDETGETFAENAEIKARAALSCGNYIGIGDDSGLEVDALNRAPGVYSARYSGADCDYDKNNTKLLHELKNVDNRSARFVCSMCCIFPDGEMITSVGTLEGEITKSRRGVGGFGYDCLFYVEKYGKTLAEMTPEEKNSISHRGSAVRQLIEKINKKLGQKQ